MVRYSRLLANGLVMVCAVTFLAGCNAFKSSVSSETNSPVTTGLSFYPTTFYDFGNRQVSVVTIPFTFTVKNTGPADASNCDFYFSGGNSGDFAVAGCAGTIGAGGGTCTVSVKSTPGALGLRTSTLQGSCGTGGLLTNTATVQVTGIRPINFIPVPGDATQGTGDFSVAKFPMKAADPTGKLWNSGNGEGTMGGGYYTPSDTVIAASKPDGTPWVNISRADAITACANLGAGYHLMTNAEWQTVARNIENTASNWYGGVIGGTGINVGHSNNVIESNAVLDGYLFSSMVGKALASCGGVDCATVAFDDANGYVGTGSNVSDGYLSGWEQKRTHTLSNDQVIWDFGANISEWVSDDMSAMTYGLLADTFAYALPVANNAKLTFGPADNYGTDPGFGKIFLDISSTGVVRGGAWDESGNAGIFSGKLNYAISSAGSTVGFRCVGP